MENFLNRHQKEKRNQAIISHAVAAVIGIVAGLLILSAVDAASDMKEAGKADYRNELHQRIMNSRVELYKQISINSLETIRDLEQKSSFKEYIIQVQKLTIENQNSAISMLEERVKNQKYCN